MALEVREEADAAARAGGLASAGDSAKGEFHCTQCGYGVTVCRALPQCPMCAGRAWRRTSWSPFRRARSSPRPPL